MEFKHDSSEVATILARSIRAELSETEGLLSFSLIRLDSKPPVCLVMPKSDLETQVLGLKQKNLGDQMALFDESSFEVIVQEESPFPSRTLREGLQKVIDTESSLEYEISPASDDYVLWLLSVASESGALRDLTSNTLIRYRADRILDMEPTISVLDFVRATVARYMTLKIKSNSAQSLKRFTQAANSFLFHIAYNMDIAMVRVRFLEELSRRGRIGRIRRSRQGELDPPRRLYNEDLVNHYVLAVSTDSPSVQFLSYYHVLEHYFDAVFNDDLIEQIKASITHPGFSYKRKKDIGQLITTIKKSLQIRSETITFSESEALRLALLKYVELAQLATQLDTYDSSLLDYYRDHPVPFSTGSAVDLRSLDSERKIKDLAKRIYATRNALVHSKDGEKARYVPFKDERALVKEIPLMRFIAEMVILNESQVV